MEDFIKLLNIHDVLILNLKHRPDRLSFMKYKLMNVKISNYKVFEAVNGYSKENMIIYNNYVFKNKNKRMMIKSPGAMGCLMSYKQIFEQYLNNKTFTSKKKLFILEDDVNFHKHFNDELKNYKNLIHTSNIVYIGANQMRWLPFQTTTHYKVFPKKYYSVYGTFGFMIDRKSMQFIYDALDTHPSNVEYTIDYLMWLTILKQNLNANVIFPNLLIADVSDSDNMKSRDLVEFAKQRKWDLSLYINIHDNCKYYQYYNDVYALNIDFYDKTLQPLPNIDNVVIGNNKEFVFIVPSYNNQESIKKNLDSILMQKYPFWRVIYINDASTDDTHECFHKLIDNSIYKDRFIYIQNAQNMKQSYSRYIGYNHISCKKHEIALLLDGDDWLYDNNVLNHLNEIYINNNLNMSWGQFYYYGKYNNKLSGYYSFPKNIDNYRHYPITVCQHLRTSKIELLQQIPASYLQDHSGQWYGCCTDVAENACILELSNKQYMNSGKPLLVYNTTNSVKYSNSYYNINKIKEQNSIRKAIMKKIKNEIPLNHVKLTRTLRHRRVLYKFRYIVQLLVFNLVTAIFKISRFMQ